MSDKNETTGLLQYVYSHLEYIQGVEDEKDKKEYKNKHKFFQKKSYGMLYPRPSLLL